MNLQQAVEQYVDKKKEKGKRGYQIQKIVSWVVKLLGNSSPSEVEINDQIRSKEFFEKDLKPFLKAHGYKPSVIKVLCSAFRDLLARCNKQAQSPAQAKALQTKIEYEWNQIIKKLINLPKRPIFLLVFSNRCRRMGISPRDKEAIEKLILTAKEYIPSSRKKIYEQWNQAKEQGILPKGCRQLHIALPEMEEKCKTYAIPWPEVPFHLQNEFNARRDTLLKDQTLSESTVKTNYPHILCRVLGFLKNIKGVDIEKFKNIKEIFILHNGDIRQESTVDYKNFLQGRKDKRSSCNSTVDTMKGILHHICGVDKETRSRLGKLIYPEPESKSSKNSGGKLPARQEMFCERHDIEFFDQRGELIGNKADAIKNPLSKKKAQLMGDLAINATQKLWPERQASICHHILGKSIRKEMGKDGKMRYVIDPDLCPVWKNRQNAHLAVIDDDQTNRIIDDFMNNWRPLLIPKGEQDEGWAFPSLRTKAKNSKDPHRERPTYSKNQRMNPTALSQRFANYTLAVTGEKFYMHTDRDVVATSLIRQGYTIQYVAQILMDDPITVQEYYNNYIQKHIYKKRKEDQDKLDKLIDEVQKLNTQLGRLSEENSRLRNENEKLKEQREEVKNQTQQAISPDLAKQFPDLIQRIKNIEKTVNGNGS